LTGVRPGQKDTLATILDDLIAVLSVESADNS